jgi:hypothetical protein
MNHLVGAIVVYRYFGQKPGNIHDQLFVPFEPVVRVYFAKLRENFTIEKEAI